MAVPFELPTELQEFTSRELLGELPFVWKPSVRTNVIISLRLMNAETPSDEDIKQIARGNPDSYILPLGVSEQVDRFTTWASPALRNVVLDYEIKNPTEEFESEVLKIDKDVTPQSHRQFDSSSGFTLPGRYPLVRVASALSADPDRLKTVLDGNDFFSATAKVGKFLFKVCSLPPYQDQKNVGVADVVKLTDAGEEVVYKTLSLLESYAD